MCNTNLNHNTVKIVSTINVVTQQLLAKSSFLLTCTFCISDTKVASEVSSLNYANFFTKNKKRG